MVHEKSAETQLERMIQTMAKNDQTPGLLEITQKVLIQSHSNESTEFYKIRPVGFEPTTLGSEDRCAIQLRHGRVDRSAAGRSNCRSMADDAQVVYLAMSRRLLFPWAIRHPPMKVDVPVQRLQMGILQLQRFGQLVAPLPTHGARCLLTAN